MDKILSDLEIGHAAQLLPIEEVAASAGIAEEHLEHYGPYIAKVTPGAAAPGVEPAPNPPASRSAALELGGSTLALTRQHTVLGRGNEADLRLDDPGVSRRHAEIVLSDPPRITDLGSTNGTFMDGERVTSAELYDGARIGIGALAMVFRFGG